MRNIGLITSDVHRCDVTTPVNVFSIDPLNGHIFLSTQYELLELNWKTKKLKSCLHLRDDGLVPADRNSHIISLYCLPEQESVCLITDDGDIFLYNVSTLQVENIGIVDYGIITSSWSPDGNILVLLTGKNTLIYMNRDFDPLQEISLLSSVEENVPVSVGWGKKETQFQGSGGRAAGSNLKIESLKVFDWDDKKPRISWRGDGRFFAVSCVTSESFRQMRIFSHEGVLQAVSETLTGLEAAIGWQPLGNLAAVQRLPAKYQVIFFEKNGLQHGEFSLPYAPNEVVIREMMWNTDSTILALWIEPLTEKKVEQGVSEIHMWSRGNHHWYLKQTIRLTTEEKLASFQWHPEKAFTLILLFTCGTIKEFNWAWQIHRSLGISNENNATVAVIDAARVLITPFQNMIVPPPEAAFAPTMPDFVNVIVFPSFPVAAKLAVILADATLVFVSMDDEKLNLTTTRMSKSNRFEIADPYLLSHWVWIREDVFVALYPKNDSTLLCEFIVDRKEETYTIDFVCPVEGLITNVSVVSYGKKLLCQLSDGKLILYSIESKTISPWVTETGRELSFPHECCDIQTCTISDQDIVFGLTNRFQLFYKDMQIMNNCSSYVLHSEFLVATSFDHKLHCIPLSVFINAASDKNTLELAEYEALRNIERGSRIITCSPQDTKLILQMPRGNLECIHPRALTISAVVRNLNELKFFEAFSLIRRHRINMNVLFDYNPQLFLDNIETFVKDVKNVNWLNVFLSDLSEANIASTMYKDIYILKRSASTNFPNKINTVCKTMRQALEAIDSDKYLLAILTTYVLTVPSELDLALSLIKKLKNNKNENLDSALLHMQYLVDVNDLYNIALGTYDFDLVIMIAQKTQKDPKEYLPFLNELRNLEENYQRFTIDCYLKRPANALKHIVKSGEKYFEECLKHVSTHKLYKMALSLFPSKSEQYQAICVAYAFHLEEKNRLDEAGVFYYRGGRCDLALLAYEKNLNWQQAMHMASVLKIDDAALVQMASQLAEMLKRQKRHKEAAYLLEIYVKHPEESISTLIEGHHWLMALEMIQRHKKEDLVLTHLMPHLLEYSTLYLSTLESMQTHFQHHESRLAVVREIKKNNQKNFELNRNADNQLLDDLASEITSIAETSTRTYVSGTSSRMTGRTSKNRRKEERKKYSLKEGGTYEDRALVEALHEIVVNADAMKEETLSLTQVLLLFAHEKEAQKIQDKFGKLLDTIKEKLNIIWKFPVEFSYAKTMENQETSNSAAAFFQNSGQFPCPMISSAEELRLMMPPNLRKLEWKIDFLNSDTNC